MYLVYNYYIVHTIQRMGNMRIFYNQNNSINMKLSEAREPLYPLLQLGTKDIHTLTFKQKWIDVVIVRPFKSSDFIRKTHATKN